MPSLNALLAAHRSLLVLDAASARIHAGWFGPEAPPQWTAGDDEANVALFRAVERLPAAALESAGAFVFCEGPGSILGIRTAAMAIRAWTLLSPRPVYRYGSLALVAHAAERRDLSVIADARRDTWHCYDRTHGLRRLAPGALPPEPATPEGFRAWTPLPADAVTVPYDVPRLFAATADADLFAATDAADAFLHEEPNYATWTPQIHRAPGSARPGQA